MGIRSDVSGHITSYKVEEMTIELIELIKYDSRLHIKLQHGVGNSYMSALRAVRYRASMLELYTCTRTHPRISLHGKAMHAPNHNIPITNAEELYSPGEPTGSNLWAAGAHI